jgi:hypothetical protein
MAHPAGESESDAPRLNFDRRLKLEFHGSSVTSDAGLLPFRELDDVLGLMVIAGQTLADGRTRQERSARSDRLLRQSVFGRLRRIRGRERRRPARRAILRCAGSLAVVLQRSRQPPPARWDASRRSGLRMMRTLSRSPISAGDGLTGCTAAVR